jgi:hypothetical protein
VSECSVFVCRASAQTNAVYSVIRSIICVSKQNVEHREPEFRQIRLRAY